MTQFPAVVASIDKGKFVVEGVRGPVLQCEFTSGQMPRVGNKGIAVVDERAKTVKFRGPRGATYLRLIATLPPT